MDQGKSVKKLRGLQRLAVWLVWGLVAIWQKSLRWRIEPETSELLKNLPPKLVYASWHNYLFSWSYLYKKFLYPKKIHCLISASGDGAYLADLLEKGGLFCVRGSSSFRSRTAIREMRKRLQKEEALAITPDGPRGPRHKVKEGLAQIAYKESAAIVLMIPNYAKSWKVKSWDRFEIPYPFSKVHVVFRLIREDVLKEWIENENLNPCEQLELMMEEITGRAKIFAGENLDS